VGAARDVAAAQGMGAYRVRDVGVPPLFLIESRIYAPILPALVIAAVTSALGFGPQWGALWWVMFPHMKTARTEGSKPGVWGYVKSIRWERAWMLAFVLPVFQSTLWSWAVTWFLTVELVGMSTLLAGFLSTSMSRGWREEPEVVDWLPSVSSPMRIKGPFTLILDGRLWLRINVLGLLQLGPSFYAFPQTPVEIMPMPGVPTPKVTGWSRVSQRLRYWADSYDKGIRSRTPKLYTFWFITLLVAWADQPILDARKLFKAIARERQARRQTLDMFTGATRPIAKLIFWISRGLVKVVPGRLGRWLAGAPDRWAERAFQHRVNHAQRMLVRNLTEQAWQRAQLAKPLSEKRKKRLRAALAENVKGAAQIRKTLKRLPGEYERRMTALHEARRDRLTAQLERVERRLARTRWADRRRDARKARLVAERALAEQAFDRVVAPPLSQGRYLRRVLERHQAESARLRAVLAQVNEQYEHARAAGDQDRAHAAKARRDTLQTRRDAVVKRARKLQQTPGAAGALVGTTLPEWWARPRVRWMVRALVLAATLVGLIVLLSLPAAATVHATAAGAGGAGASGAGWWFELGRFLGANGPGIAVAAAAGLLRFLRRANAPPVLTRLAVAARAVVGRAGVAVVALGSALTRSAGSFRGSVEQLRDDAALWMQRRVASGRPAVVALWAAVVVAVDVLIVEFGVPAAAAGGLSAMGLPFAAGGLSMPEHRPLSSPTGSDAQPTRTSLQARVVGVVSRVLRWAGCCGVRSGGGCGWVLGGAVRRVRCGAR
jgi:hypothetical protein